MLEMLFGERLKELRRVHHLTQRQMAQTVGLSVQYYGRIEQGKVSPSFLVIEQICAALGIEPFNLFFFGNPLSDSESIAGFAKKQGFSVPSNLMYWGPRPSHNGTIFIIRNARRQIWTSSVYRMPGYPNTSEPSTVQRLVRHVLPQNRKEVTSFLEEVTSRVHPAFLVFKFIRKESSLKNLDFDSCEDDSTIRPRIGLLHVEPGDLPLDGDVVVSLTIIDVTEWKYLEQALVGNTKNLEESICQRNEKLALALEQYHLEMEHREQLESDLRRFERIVSISNDAQAFIDTEFRYRIVNDSYLRLFGKTEEQVLGRHVVEVFGKQEFRSEIKPHLKQALKGEQVSFCRWLEFSESGRRLVLAVYAPYWDDQVVTGVAVTLHDLTDVKVLEDRLYQRELQYQVIVETANEGIRIVDEDGFCSSIRNARPCWGEHGRRWKADC